MMLRRLLPVLCLLVSTAVFAQSADIGITASDSPDPVAPDGNVTYTVTVSNAGPDSAANVSMSVVQNNTMLYQSITAPAGWTCPSLSPGYGGGFTCTTATMAATTNAVFTVVLKAAKSQFGISDQTINQLFTASSQTTSDPNNGNNAVTVQTAYDAPNVDMQITASDSPDPVAPDGNVTYTVTVTNAGPDATTNASMSVILNNTMLFQSMTTPAGWSCPSPAVNSGASFTCTAANFASGASSVFTVVLKAAQSQFGINDQTINQLFTTGSDWSDPNNGNNAVTVQTAYSTPDADIQITASDSPDPVAPDGNITYTVTVTNAGPDTATTATLNVPLNNTLLFQSITTPAGWTCSPPAVNGGSSFSCTNASFAPGSSVFTVVLKAAKSQFGIADQTISQTFTANSGVSDPNNGNNATTVQTAYVTPDADMRVTASDSPDPVTPDQNITYTVTVTNAGPDTATTATLNVPLNNTLLFQSISAPAGWTCNPPAVNGGSSFTCTNPSFAVGSAAFTIVLKAAKSQFGNTNQTISQTFTVAANEQEPNNANNAATVTTSYVVPQANLAITNSDSPDPVVSGSTITYTQTLTSAGPDTAANVAVDETIGSGVTFQSIVVPAGFNCTTPAVDATGTIHCTASSFASGASAVFTVVVKVTASSGTITNIVTAGSDAQDTTSSNNSATATTTVQAPPSADLSVAKSTLTTNAAPGTSVTYTIAVKNNGPDAAASVALADTLPASLLFQSISAPAGFTCTTPAVNASGAINCTAATLTSGTTATFSLVAKIAAGTSGNVTNTATVSSATTDPVPGNNASGASLNAGAADLSMTGGSSASGTTITYTFTLNNLGPDPAANVVFTDNLPSSLLFKSVNAPGFICTAPPAGTTGTVTCTAASFAAGSTVTFTLVTQAAPGATGTINNGASISSATADPTPTNSSAAAPGVPAPVVSPENIPALSEWLLIALACALGVAAIAKVK